MKCALLGDAVFGGRAGTLGEMVGSAVRDEGKTLAVAKSSTGGQVAQMLTRAPGASDYPVLDALVYANHAEWAVLRVSPDVLRVHGAVSAETAAAKGKGALRVAWLARFVVAVR